MLGTIIGFDGTTLICMTPAGVKHFKTAEGHVQGDQDRLHCVCYINGDFAGDMSQLQIGDEVEIEGQPAIRIKATRKSAEPRRYEAPESHRYEAPEQYVPSAEDYSKTPPYSETPNETEE